MKILIIKPSSLGDIIHTLPAVNMIKKQLPNAEIHWFVSDALKNLVECFPIIDKVIIFKRKELGKFYNFQKIFTLIKELKNEKYDLIFDFQGLFRSAFFGKMAKAKEFIGFAKPRDGFLAAKLYKTKFLVPSEIKHAVEKNNYLVKKYFNLEESTEFEFPEAILKANDSEKLLNEIPNYPNTKIVAVAPESRWKSKSWNPEFFAKVLDYIIEKNANVEFWLLGTKDEQESGKKVQTFCRKAMPINFMGKSNFETMIALLKKSDAMLTNDSGPMHIGAALQIPVFALFGPTNSELTGPYGLQNQVFNADLDCAPCFQRECQLKSKQYLCHDKIEVASVANAILKQLEK